MTRKPSNNKNLACPAAAEPAAGRTQLPPHEGKEADCSHGPGVWVGTEPVLLACSAPGSFVS